MESEPEPLPIESTCPILEIAWRGLLYSVEAGYLTRDEAVTTLKDWNDGKPSSVFPVIEDEGL